MTTPARARSNSDAANPDLVTAADHAAPGTRGVASAGRGPGPGAAPRHVAIVGGGVTGCVLAERIKDAWPQARVTLLEGGPTLGGLSVRSEPDEIGWDRFYHVVTPQDTRLLGWLERLGLGDRVRWRSARSGFFAEGALHPFDTPLDFLRFPPLNLADKARLAATILYASRIRDGAPLEDITAVDWLRRLSGPRVTAKIWEPLLRAKLGDAYDQVAASFIWSTIRRLYATREGKDRREAFGYISGGYAPVFATAARYLGARGVAVRTGTRVTRVERTPAGLTLSLTSEGDAAERLDVDRVVFTGPSRAVPQLFGGAGVPEELLARAARQRYLGVLCMVLKLRRMVSPHYVLNITDPGLPFTGVIGLTTLVDPEEVGGHHLIYLPRYLPDDAPDFQAPDEAFYAPFMAGMQRIFARRGFVPRDVLLWRMFRTRFVSPLHTLRYDRERLPVTLSPGRVYLLNTGRVLGGTLNNNQMIEEAEAGLGEVLS